MSIKDEIEKLDTIVIDKVCFLVHKADVLSILDEWKLAVEITGEDWLCPPSPDPLDQIDIIPGDHIIIYVRREKDES